MLLLPRQSGLDLAAFRDRLYGAPSPDAGLACAVLNAIHLSRVFTAEALAPLVEGHTALAFLERWGAVTRTGALAIEQLDTNVLCVPTEHGWSVAGTFNHNPPLGPTEYGMAAAFDRGAHPVWISHSGGRFAMSEPGLAESSARPGAFILDLAASHRAMLPPLDPAPLHALCFDQGVPDCGVLTREEPTYLRQVRERAQALLEEARQAAPDELAATTRHLAVDPQRGVELRARPLEQQQRGPGYLFAIDAGTREVLGVSVGGMPFVHPEHRGRRIGVSMLRLATGAHTRAEGPFFSPGYYSVPGALNRLHAWLEAAADPAVAAPPLVKLEQSCAGNILAQSGPTGLLSFLPDAVADAYTLRHAQPEPEEEAGLAL